MTASHYVAQATLKLTMWPQSGLKIMILLSQSPNYWNWRHGPLYPT